MSKQKPLILIILDGWGYTESTFYNAIHSANKPTWEMLWQNHPHTLLNASGLDVGLPANQMGNSEVGHVNMGAGRLVDQEFTRINHSIESGEFFSNPVLIQTLDKAVSNDRTVHLLGLLSPGGVHSHEDHIHTLMDMAVARGVKKLCLHAFLDGRDTPPKSAGESISLAQQKLQELRVGRFSSIVGRHYAMDRNRHWERTRMTYDLISQGKAEFRSVDPFLALDMAYSRGETDEFVHPTAITPANQPPATVEDGDVLIFANYRADRARQLARAFSKKDFGSFPRERRPELDAFISLTSYKANYDFPVAFPPKRITNTLGEYLSKHGMRQLRIAETEKYAHVTFFFNGGEEQVYEGETRILVPSPHVHTYDLMPQMSAEQVTEKLNEAVRDRKFDVIICNFANADMVGHTGNFDAAIRAVETLDQCLGEIHGAIRRHGGEMLITADHGNAEQMRAYTGEKIKSGLHTAHTSNLVPLIYVGRDADIQPDPGTLSDIAPSMLHILGMEPPEEMTGHALFRLKRNGG